MPWGRRLTWRGVWPRESRSGRVSETGWSGGSSVMIMFSTLACRPACSRTPDASYMTCMPVRRQMYGGSPVMIMLSTLACCPACSRTPDASYITCMPVRRQIHNSSSSIREHADKHATAL